jgi:hypothetical protein
VLNGARSYDPFTGSYLQLDPLVAHTWSAYAYANHDPVNKDDPSGRRVSVLGEWKCDSSTVALPPVYDPATQTYMPTEGIQLDCWWQPTGMDFSHNGSSRGPLEARRGPREGGRKGKTHVKHKQPDYPVLKGIEDFEDLTLEKERDELYEKNRPLLYEKCINNKVWFIFKNLEFPFNVMTLHTPESLRGTRYDHAGGDMSVKIKECKDQSLAEAVGCAYGNKGLCP